MAASGGPHIGERVKLSKLRVERRILPFHLPVQQAVEAPRFALDAKPNFYKPGVEISVTIEKRVPQGR